MINCNFKLDSVKSPFKSIVQKVYLGYGTVLNKWPNLNSVKQLSFERFDINETNYDCIPFLDNLTELKLRSNSGDDESYSILN